MNIVLIAAVTLDGFIARHSHETVEWSEDLSLFKKQTFSSPVIIGFNTFKTLPAALENRKITVVRREDNPERILSKITAETCFVIGGGKTNELFAPYLTHMFLTVHPFIFGQGVKLFGDLQQEISVEFIRKIDVNPKKGIYQFQYSIKQ